MKKCYPILLLLVCLALTACTVLPDIGITTETTPTDEDELPIVTISETAAPTEATRATEATEATKATEATNATEATAQPTETTQTPTSSGSIELPVVPIG